LLYSSSVRTKASTTLPKTKKTEAPRSIFVVHGHDEGMLNAVTRELKGLDIVLVVLDRMRSSDDHLFAKFKAVASDAKHAIVLISGELSVPLSATSCIQRGARLDRARTETVQRSCGRAWR
jgi:predicted nucleotide-binding protein